MVTGTSLTPWNWGGRRFGRGPAGLPFAEYGDRYNELFERARRGFDLVALAGRLDGLAAFNPKVDVSETDGEYRIAVELPGIDDKDIEVTLSDNRLTIKGEKRVEKDGKRNDAHVIERAHGAFQRSFVLPAETDATQTSAKLDNGVLTLTVPKTAAARHETKKIAIKKK